MDPYLVFSLKLQGWWSKSGTYTSTIDQARRFTRAEAIVFCQKRFTGELDADGLSAVPVAEKDVMEIMGK